MVPVVASDSCSALLLTGIGGNQTSRRLTKNSPAPRAAAA
jgi:hypothetical protein